MVSNKEHLFTGCGKSYPLDGVSAFSQIKVKTEKREKVKLNAMLMQDGKNCVSKETLGHFHLNLPLEQRNV